jgi:hypothetical protein
MLKKTKVVMADFKSLLVLGFSLRMRKSLDEIKARRIENSAKYNEGSKRLSVDIAIWPEDSLARHKASLLDCEEDVAFYLDIDVCKLKVDPNRLDEYFLTEYCLVAICSTDEVREKLFGKWVNRFPKSQFISVDSLDPAKWEFLGFDVCDRNGYSPNLEQFAIANVNQYGLFRSLDDALLFCIDAGNAISEHDEFFPFGLIASRKDKLEKK